MFGLNVGNLNIGSAKSMAEEIEERDQKIAEYENLLSELAGLKESSREYFTELVADRAEMDKSLTKVVGFVHEGGELANAGAGDATDLEKRLASAREKLGTSGTREKDFSVAMDATAAELTDIVEQNKHFTTPAKELAAGAKSLREELAAAQGQAEELSTYFRNMSVTALTAAIDAGRMGAGAEKFVQTAEDIRIQSEQKERTMQEMIAAMQSLTARLDAFDENIEKMTLLQKDSNMASYQALTHLEERRKALEGAGDAPDAGKELAELAEKAASLKAKQERIFEKQNAILDEMEVLGQNFMEERKASEKAEEDFARAFGTISFPTLAKIKLMGQHPSGLD